MNPLFVIGGVAGCGKSTLGAALAAALGLPFLDGDDLHPPANKATMAAGTPLTDADRAPWLAACAAQLAAWGDGGGVLCASALKRAYRAPLYGAHPRVIYVLIETSLQAAVARAAARAESGSGHFWPAALTASQFAILEVPGDDEPALRVDAEWSTEAQVASIVSSLSGLRERRD